MRKKKKIETSLVKGTIKDYNKNEIIKGIKKNIIRKNDTLECRKRIKNIFFIFLYIHTFFFLIFCICVSSVLEILE